MVSDSPSRTNWSAVLLLWVAGLGAAAQYGKISVIFDQLPTVYPQAGTLLGWAVGLVGGVGIVLGVSAGVLAARFDPRRIVLGALVLGAVVSALQALILPLPVFLATRVLEGLSHLALVVAAPTLIAALSADRDRGMTLTLWGTFFGVAFAVLSWGGLPLVDRFGIGALFLAHALWMLLSALALFWGLPSGITGQSGPDQSSEGSLWARHAAIYTSARIGAPAAGWLFYTFCFVSLLTLLPPYLSDQSRAFVMGAIPLVSIGVSMTLGVWLLRRVSSITVVQTGFLGSAACAGLLVLIGAPAPPWVCLVFAGFLGLVQGASFAAVPDLNASAQDRMLANGGMAQTGNIGNTLGTPLLFSVVSAAGYGAMMGTLLAVLVLGAAAHAVLATLRRTRRV